jgi:hypothetical protein
MAEFVDDEQFAGGELRLEFQETPLVARFHQLMNEPGRGEEGDGEAALTSGEARALGTHASCRCRCCREQ